MSKKYHRVPQDVKADILRRIKEEGVTVAQAAKDAGISDATIYDWLGKGATGAPSWAEFARLQRQNKELFEVVGELTVKLSQAQKRIDGAAEQVGHGASHECLTGLALLPKEAAGKGLGAQGADRGGTAQAPVIRIAAIGSSAWHGPETGAEGHAPLRHQAVPQTWQE